tara:strand:+ start:2676 stop:2903 length:228 start_codon:yes stop_codon:yes gene_type:complete
MAVHGYISLRDSSSLTFGAAVKAALRWSKEEAAHASGERIEGGWLISFHKNAKDGKAGKNAVSSWRVVPNQVKRG